MDRSTRPYVFAWVMALLFYVLEYSTRSAPGVMISQLEQGFGTNGVGIGSILGSYYYTYSITSLVAGLTLDRFGAKYVVPTGSCILGIGCLLFIFGSSETAYVARLLQGAGSAFAFTGAVYRRITRIFIKLARNCHRCDPKSGNAGRLRGPVCRRTADAGELQLANGLGLHRNCISHRFGRLGPYNTSAAAGAFGWHRRKLAWPVSHGLKQSAVLPLWDRIRASLRAYDDRGDDLGRRIF